MNLRPRFHITCAVILWVGLSLSAQAGPATAQQIKKDPIEVMPDSAIYEKWLDQLFETDEIWRFKSPEDYEKVLKTSGIDPEFRHELSELYRSSLTHEEFNKSILHRDESRIWDGYVILSKDQLARVPQSLFQEVYSYRLNTYGLLPQFSHSPLSQAEFQLSQDAQDILGRHLVLLKGKPRLLLTSESWSQLPRKTREKILKTVLKERSERSSLQLTLTVHRTDNLKAIAEKFAGDRDPKAIERFLRLKLGSAQSIELPLEEILHPFVRRWIHRFSECHGPNCFNAGLSTNQGYRYSKQFVDDQQLIQALRQNYRLIAPTEKLQTGDLLLYENAFGQPTHVSSFVGDGIVFTKNGLNRQSPYAFQEISVNEILYFPNRRFRLLAYRPVSSQEQSDLRTAAQQGERVFYRVHPDLEYTLTGLIPNQSKREKSNRVRELFHEMIRPEILEELRRALRDPRLSDFHADLKKIVQQNEEVAPLYDAFHDVTFNPHASAQENMRWLEYILKKDTLSPHARQTLEWIHDHRGREYSQFLKRASDHFQLPELKVNKAPTPLEGCLNRVLNMIRRNN